MSQDGVYRCRRAAQRQCKCALTAPMARKGLASGSGTFGTGGRTGRSRSRDLDHYFYQGETTLDVDNMAKSLLDGLKGVLFRDDRQVSELLVRKSRFSAGLSLTGASLYLLEAIERMSQTGSDFVNVRADPAPDHGRIS
jgi:hypothetical protein